jgi:chaperone modulatory protein CbpM
MNDTTSSGLRGSIVEEEVTLTTIELCRACNASESHIELWVAEGVLQPSGSSRDEWRFGGRSLARMRAATRLARDLEINSSGVALALELLDEIEKLEARLRQVSARPPRP